MSSKVNKSNWLVEVQWKSTSMAGSFYCVERAWTACDAQRAVKLDMARLGYAITGWGPTQKIKTTKLPVRI